MSAARLREAAKVLRENAATATPGPWEATDSFGRDAGRAYVVPGDPEIPNYVSAGGSPDEDRDAEYIATMHPGVGLALADWLDRDADTYSDTEGFADRIADLILGGEQS